MYKKKAGRISQTMEVLPSLYIISDYELAKLKIIANCSCVQDTFL